MLAGFSDAMTIVGGSAPPLLTGDRPDDPYVGTPDVDLVIDPMGRLWPRMRSEREQIAPLVRNARPPSGTTRQAPSATKEPERLELRRGMLSLGCELGRHSERRCRRHSGSSHVEHHALVDEGGIGQASV